MKTSKVLLLILFLFISSVSAQSLFMKDFYNGKRSLSFTFNKTMFEDSPQNSLNGFYSLGYIHPINDGWSVEGVLSYMNNKGDYDYWDPKSGIGNVYVGMNKLSESGNSNYSFGVFLPTTKDETWLNSHFGYHAYDLGYIAKNGVMIRGNYSYLNENNSGFIYGFEVGPDIYVSTEGGGDGMEAYIHAAGKIGYNFGAFKLFGEVSNLFVVTEDPKDFKDRFVNHFGIGASYRVGNFEFNINYKNTFEKTNSNYNGGLGFGVKMFGF